MLRDLGMSPDSKLLDIGCGWLRSGVWFIDYLEPNCFFGIEPWEERLELGWSRVLWEGLREEKWRRRTEERMVKRKKRRNRSTGGVYIHIPVVILNSTMVDLIYTAEVTLI